jgi:chromosome segregation ATPase
VKLRQAQRITREFADLQKKLNDLDLARVEAEKVPAELEARLEDATQTEARASADARRRSGEIARLEERHAEELAAFKARHAEENATAARMLEDAVTVRRYAEDQTKALREKLTEARTASDSYLPKRAALARELARHADDLPKAQEVVENVQAKEADRAKAEAEAKRLRDEAMAKNPELAKQIAMMEETRKKPQPVARGAFFEIGQRIKRPRRRAPESEKRR